MSLKSGTRLNDRYTVLRPLGQGGSSQTFLAEDHAGHRFAIKTLHFERLTEWKVLEMFDRQFDLLKHLKHDGIPKVYEVFEATIDGSPRRFLVQDYIDGVTLKEKLNDGARYDEAQARSLLDALLDILEYLHSFSPPIIHRDVKPSNIILRESDGAPVLIDFDAARGEGIDHQVADGTMVGTAGYVPMEQLAGRPTLASDIYGLGMTLIAVLTRKDPTDLPVEKMRIQFETFTNISEPLRRTLAATIEPDVDARLQTARAVRAHLASPAPEGSPVHKPERRDRSVLPGLGGLVDLRGLIGPGGLVDLRGLIGPGGPGGLVVGLGGKHNHYKRDQMEAKEWHADRRLVWPISATASSQYGLGWKANSVCGPPTVYPWFGDRLGAWASETPSAGREWLTAVFPDSAPPARAVWVFETYNPGAIVGVDLLDDYGASHTVWEGKAFPFPESMVFEVDWGEPRKVHSVRLNLDTSSVPGWNQIDSVALVCAEAAHPDPVNWRHQPKGKSMLIIAVIALALIAIGFVIASESLKDDFQGKDVPKVTESIANTTHRRLTPRAVTDLDVTWASRVFDFSSEYSSPSWAATAALGPPNVWPGHGDKADAWAPSTQDAEFAWIEVAFPSAVRTSQILVLETYNPGAIARIDDTSSEQAVTLWEGKAWVEGTSYNQASLFTLKKPREISSIRLVLNTGRVDGWNEIDAIGLVAE